MMDITLTNLTTYLTQVAPIIAGFVALWRYVGSPSLKAAKKVHATSEELAKALPILLDLAKIFSKESKLTLPEKIKDIEGLILLNTELIKILTSKVHLAWFQANPSGDYVYISDELLKIMGLTFDQAKNSGWKNAISSQNREIVIKEWEDAINEKREFNSNFSYSKFPETNPIHVYCQTIIVKDSNGSIIAYIGVVVNHV